MLRSRNMICCKMLIPVENAFEAIALIGFQGCVEFIRKEMVGIETTDVNPEYTRMVRKCFDLEQLVKSLKDDMIVMNPVDATFRRCDSVQFPSVAQLEQLEQVITDIRREEQMIVHSLDQVSEQVLLLKAMHDVFCTAKQYADSTALFSSMTDLSPSATPNTEDSVRTKSTTSIIVPGLSMGLLFVLMGTVSSHQVSPLTRLLNTVSYGNVLFRVLSSPKRYTSSETDVFIIMSPSIKIHEMSKKSCDFLGLRYFEDPMKSNVLSLSSIEKEIRDKEIIVESLSKARSKLYDEVTQNSRTWRCCIMMMKSIFHTLNQFDCSLIPDVLIGYCWMCEEQRNEVESLLDEFDVVIIPINPDRTWSAPIHYEADELLLTASMQAILGNAINEQPISGLLNPAAFSLIPFCFLFAMMFADFGHALLLVFISTLIYLLNRNAKQYAEIYPLIVMCGMSAAYAGLLMNTCFGIPLVITPRNWSFGMNIRWVMASNCMLFDNSMRMKMSVIVAVVHSLLGYSLCCLETWKMNRKMELFLKQLPHMFMFMFIAGYLASLIIIKWTMTFKDPSCSPSLIEHFINMMFFRYTNEPCYTRVFYPGQKPIQCILLLFSFLCLAVSLLGLPVHVYISDREKFDLNFIIYHLIDWIEKVLSIVSHVASYLRLWAISLAHNQLTDLSMIAIMYVITGGGGCREEGGGGLSSKRLVVRVALTALLTPVWIAVTVGVLVILEGSTAALHALRLNWIEFQSKFVVHGTPAGETETRPFRPMKFCLSEWA